MTAAKIRYSFTGGLPCDYCPSREKRLHSEEDVRSQISFLEGTICCYIHHESPPEKKLVDLAYQEDNSLAGTDLPIE